MPDPSCHADSLPTDSQLEAVHRELDRVVAPPPELSTELHFDDGTSVRLSWSQMARLLWAIEVRRPGGAS